ncbi:MAG: trypsin-like serine protease [Bacteroidota bacterium]
MKTVLPQLICLLLTIVLIQPLNAQYRVTGGEDVEEGTYPWMAGLADASQSNLEEAQFCGGTLIDRYWVLTAAHCIDDFQSSLLIDSIDVFLGAYDLVNPAAGHERLRVKNIYLHPSFFPLNSKKNDIALLELEEPSSRSPIQLPEQSDESYYAAGTAARVLGWGIQNSMTLEAATALQEAEIEVIDFDDCNAPTAYGGEVSSDMVCAGYLSGEPEMGAASGDSGGPLFVSRQNEWIQTGVVSWGQLPWTTDQYPGVFQKVAFHRAWIDEVMSNSTVNTEEQPTESLNFTVYTNETNLIVASKRPVEQQFEFFIVDMMGQTIRPQQSRINGWTQQKIDIQGLPTGMYTLLMVNEKKRLNNRFFIHQ